MTLTARALLALALALALVYLVATTSSEGDRPATSPDILTY